MGGGYTVLAEPRARPRVWRRRGRAVLDWWLMRLRGHRIVVHLGVALVIWGILKVTLDALHVRESALTGPGTEVLIVTISISLPLLLTFIALHKQIRLTFALLDVPARSVPAMRRIVTQELSTLNDRIDGLLRGGLPFPPDAIPDWLRRTCFSGASGAYLAVDTFRPSEFMQRYEDLLDAHRRYLDDGAPRSARINVVSRDALRTDAAREPARYKEYVDWHSQNGVLLLHCSPQVARKHARKHDLGDAPADVGLWVGELALLGFMSGSCTRIHVGLVDELLYRNVASYIRALLADAAPLP